MEDHQKQSYKIEWALQYECFHDYEERGRVRLLLHYLEINGMIYGNYIGYSGGGCYDDYLFRYNRNAGEFLYGGELNWYLNDRDIPLTQFEEYIMDYLYLHREIEPDWDYDGCPRLKKKDYEKYKAYEEDEQIFVHSFAFDHEVNRMLSQHWGLLLTFY